MGQRFRVELEDESGNRTVWKGHADDAEIAVRIARLGSPGFLPCSVTFETSA